MDKQGQTEDIGKIVVIAIGIIVGAILLTASAQNVGQVRDTATLANLTIPALGAEGNSVYITNYKSISSPVIFNATGTIIPAAHYTVTNNVVYNGALAVQITTNATSAFANDSANISGTAQPLTYESSASGRSVAYLIVILSALALAAWAISYAVKEYKGM